MEIRKLSSTDYEDILVGWWNDWRWTAPPKSFLPEDGEGGFIIHDGDTPVCAGFFYITNSKVGWCDWIVSNFQYKDKEKRKEALSKLIEVISYALKNMGCEFAFTVLKNKSLINLYEELGYQQGSTGSIEMVKKLWQQ